MLLTGPEIARRVAAGELTIEPFDPARVNPNSYNLRLCDQILVYAKNKPLHDWHARREFFRSTGSVIPSDEMLPPILEPLDMAVEEKTCPLQIVPKGLVLYPGVIYLGATMEFTDTPNLAPKIDGRSSAGRLGLCVHLTAGFGDRKFSGDWTLELTVVTPLRVYAGVAICQIAYTELVGEPQDYKGKYQGQRGPKPSGLWRDFLPKEEQQVQRPDGPAVRPPDGEV